MNRKKNEFITASTVFSSDTVKDEKPMAEKISTEIMHPEVYYG